MNLLIESIPLLLGAAHAAIFGVFLIAAAGKLAACMPGARVMCTKGSVDAALALLACLVMVPRLGLASGIAAVAVGAGGWLRERITRNTICNCFGVLTAVLHPWRNRARALLAGAGAVVILLAPEFDAAGAGLWAGAALGLSALLATTALAFARSSLKRQGISVATIKQIVTLPPGTISPDTVVGTDKSGRELALRDLMTPGSPLALLLTAPACKSCHLLRNELAPMLPGLPFPTVIVNETGARAAFQPSGLFDPDGTLRKTLGVESLPALALIDAAGTNLACPVALGADAVKVTLLHRLTETRPAAVEAPAQAA